jgi:PTH1 family peptidyl-tRNA hydrolase
MNSFLIVGLGNPGPQYALTRHNIGFMALDMYAEGCGLRNWGTEHKAWVLKLKTEQGQFILAKPQTYMNRSGEAVQGLLQYYKIPLENLLVLHDEVDLPFGKMKFVKNRGAGGNNGVKSITELLGTPDYCRLRMGVGRPPVPGPDVADWVLSKFSKEEEPQLPDFLNRAGDGIECWASEGIQIASTQFNS